MNETGVKRNVILEKTFKFSLSTINMCRELRKNREYILADQLLRSGTSIGANVEESIAAQSRKDFIHKMSIASKEARETRYWLRLLESSKMIEFKYSEMLNEIEEITRILSSIIKSSKERD